MPRRAADVVLADRELASLKYTPINPTFGPPQSYLNFEVAIEKSDSGIIYVYIPLFLITKKNGFKHFQCVNYCVRSYVLLFPNIFNFGSYFFKWHSMISLFLSVSKDFLHMPRTTVVWKYWHSLTPTHQVKCIFSPSLPPPFLPPTRSLYLSLPHAPSLPQSLPVSLSLPLSFSRTTSLSLPLSPSFFIFLLIFLPFYLPSYVWVASFFYYLITSIKIKINLWHKSQQVLANPRSLSSMTSSHFLK